MPRGRSVKRSNRGLPACSLPFFVRFSSYLYVPFTRCVYAKGAESRVQSAGCRVHAVYTVEQNGSRTHDQHITWYFRDRSTIDDDTAQCTWYTVWYQLPGIITIYQVYNTLTTLAWLTGDLVSRSLTDLRIQEPYNAETEHVGFSPIRQTLFAPTAKRREVLGESQEGWAASY